LPAVAEATAAFDAHQSLAGEIKAPGAGITVEVGRPCPDPDRGLIMVRYRSRAQRDAIAGLLSQREGFGVPVHLNSGTLLLVQADALPGANWRQERWKFQQTDCTRQCFTQ
jgi:hypothetical protein